MRQLITAIVQKHEKDGIDIYPGAMLSEIDAFEQKIGFPLPDEFRRFYLLCNGFGCNEDIFNIIPLAAIMEHPDHYGDNWFYFSEYMIYLDMWGLRFLGDNCYEIFNASDLTIGMTSSLTEFLQRFLKGNVFDPGGLYKWHQELGIIS
ncbi:MULTISPECIES: SMI1/KNR4 family protein [Sphingobacterium]|uniref:Knr4/Smi1-like domain-containing protein n=1 Tax=Sphingobacterium ginsenosidimutans TaxID=687845 RepID=A0ABP8A5D1_9SPHI|nr:SMI1/KNR4 family protein [Sphingobacterium sp. E70]ULT24916.1 SMI1/KNR4 family protein [Sphingobacterium sp. E70]